MRLHSLNFFHSTLGEKKANVKHIFCAYRVPDMQVSLVFIGGIEFRQPTKMAMFVHLTLESLVPRIRRNGIARLRKSGGVSPQGIFAVPVARNFFASHQWLRELKRRNRGPIAAIYFRVPDDEPVWIGHYGQVHRWMTAAEAVAQFATAKDPLGWQVVIPRRIEAGEIHNTRRLSQVIGWRFFPKAKGKPPFCTCKFCIGGEFGAAKLRNRRGSPDDE